MYLLPIILASQSPSRLKLLNSINITPSDIVPADIDETPAPKELPRNLASRLANEKAKKVLNKVENGYIIAADTVVAVGRRILPKALVDNDVAYSLRMLSGRRHRVYTGVTIIKVQDSDIITTSHKVVTTVVKMKRLTLGEIAFYVASKKGLNKAGGYSIKGLGQCLIQFVNGSVSNVIGLPLFETRNMLLSLGFDCLKS